MDFHYTTEQEAFRQQARDWLAANLTPDLQVEDAMEDAMDERVPPDRDAFERRIAWHKKLYAAGWVGLAWPKEYGGRGASLMGQIIYHEEYGRARAPVLPGYVGLSPAGPTIAQCGTEKQKAHFLPRILAGDHV